MTATVPLLVSADWLADRLDDPQVRVADVRWTLLDPGKGRASYAAAHIRGAVFLDLASELAAPRGEGPGRHPLPSATRFTAAMSRAGVDDTTHVIACDFGDGATAARLWWLLRWFGHERVSLLDGGMARWLAEGREVDARQVSHASRAFVARPESTSVIDAAGVERLRHDPGTLLLDARAAERYEGRVEPIDPVAGHIPGAVSHPFAGNVRAPGDSRFLDPADLRKRFVRLGADRVERVVCYCGSGVNACQNLFALALAGFRHGILYEGSWSDWCSVPERAMKTGAEP